MTLVKHTHLHYCYYWKVQASGSGAARPACAVGGGACVPTAPMGLPYLHDFLIFSLEKQTKTDILFSKGKR